MSSGRPDRIWAWIFGVHLVLVCGLSLLFVIVALLGDPEHGANIGAGSSSCPYWPWVFRGRFR